MKKFNGLSIQSPCTPDCDKRSAFCKRECDAFKKYEREKFQAYRENEKLKEIQRAINECESNRFKSFEMSGGHKFKHGRASGNRGR